MATWNKSFKLAIICIFIIGGLFTFTRDSLATNSAFIGFIIEADQMEGTLKNLAMVTGQTAEQKSQQMLEMEFQDARAEGLVINKVFSTPKGLVTVKMSAKDTAVFNHIKLDVTNAEFSEAFKPQDGNIGFKNVKLLTHLQTSDSANLSEFNISFNEGEEMWMTPDSEETLIQKKQMLEGLLLKLNP